MEFDAYLSMPEYTALQGIVSMYVTEMGPPVNHGWYYLRYILLQQVVDGQSISANKRIHQAGRRYSRNAGNVSRCINTFLRKAYRPPNSQRYIHRWRELGWENEQAPTAPYAIRMLYDNFLPYLKRHHPQEYQEVLDLPLRSFPPGSPQK